MTNKEALYKLMKYYSTFLSCDVNDFFSDTNKVILAEQASDKFFKIVCFGNAAVAKVNEKIYDWCWSFVSKYTGFRCFDGVEMTLVYSELIKYNYSVSCGQGAIPDLT